uniref:Arachidonate 5-lipoxygenase-activating protein n=1 Tax=Oryzias latipes TaxID=8090 RepID=A0A3P9MBG4_ORYLA
MNSSTAVENIYLLVIVTLISVLQNAFFAQKVEQECQKENKHTPSFERVSCANRNCMDAYPTFLAVMWCAGVCLSQGNHLTMWRQQCVCSIAHTQIEQNSAMISPFCMSLLLFIFLTRWVGYLKHFWHALMQKSLKECTGFWSSVDSSVLLL